MEEKQAIHSGVSKPALSRVRMLCQSSNGFEEFWGLAKKKPGPSEKINHPHGNSFWLRGTNHSATGQVWANECAGNREDKVGLQQWIVGCIEVREGEPVGRIGERSDWRLHAITREIHPF
jgi:hypothetical protein